MKTKALFWSVDPYMRVYPKLFGFVPPMTMIGSQVCMGRFQWIHLLLLKKSPNNSLICPCYKVSEVVESKNEEFKVGDKMVVCNGWRDAHVFNPADRY